MNVTPPARRAQLRRLRLRPRLARWRRRLRTTGVAAIRRRPVADWVAGKAFEMVHRRNLVYNTCWEDPRLDREALELGSEDTVLVITSAGCNALDYALDGPRQVYAVDMNPRQNALLELKLAGLRELEYEDYFRLFGEGRLPGFEDVFAGKLQRHLSPWASNYWEKRIRYFGGGRSFYFRGSSGAVARLVNIYIDRIAKVRRDIDALLAASTLEEQRAIYFERVRPAFWTRAFRRFIGSHAVLAMLGVPCQQRQQVEHHFGSGIAEFVESCLETVFTRLPLHDNYFWRVYIAGRYTLECCPEYLRRENFEALRGGLADRVSVHTDTVEGFLRTIDDRISRFVLLDHMDWLSTFRYEALQSEWQAIVDRATDRARILFRSGGLRVHYVDPIEVRLASGSLRLGELLTYYSDWAARLHEQCRVHTYGSMYIADLATA